VIRFADGRHLTFDHRLRPRTHSGAPSRPGVSFTYDESDRVVHAEHGAGWARYTHDADQRGSIIRIEQHPGPVTWAHRGAPAQRGVRTSRPDLLPHPHVPSGTAMAAVLADGWQPVPRGSIRITSHSEPVQPSTTHVIPAPPTTAVAAGAEVQVVPRAVIDSWLDNLNALLREVRLVPVYQAGQITGFQLAEISPDGFLHRARLRDRDILRFVNGRRIDAVQAAFELYGILRDSTILDVTLIRNGQPVTLRYLIDRTNGASLGGGWPTPPR
jgi:hypothetical protein